MRKMLELFSNKELNELDDLVDRLINVGRDNKEGILDEMVDGSGGYYWIDNYGDGLSNDELVNKIVNGFSYLCWSCMVFLEKDEYWSYVDSIKSMVEELYGEED